MQKHKQKHMWDNPDKIKEMEEKRYGGQAASGSLSFIVYLRMHMPTYAKANIAGTGQESSMIAMI